MGSDLNENFQQVEHKYPMLSLANTYNQQDVREWYDSVRRGLGGDDFEDAGEEWIIFTEPTELMAVKGALEEQGIEVKGAEFIMDPTNPVAVSVEDDKKVQRLIDRLEDFDDVQSVAHTMEVTDEIAAALED